MRGESDPDVFMEVQKSKLLVWHLVFNEGFLSQKDIIFRFGIKLRWYLGSFEYFT